MKLWLLIAFRCLGIYSLVLASGIFLLTLRGGSPIHQYLSPVSGFLGTVLLFGGALFIPFCGLAAILAGMALFRPGVIPKAVGAIWLTLVVAAALVISEQVQMSDETTLELGKYTLFLVGFVTLVLTFIHGPAATSEANDQAINPPTRSDSPKSTELRDD
jgi:membrane protein implicated in regulation of membrane protease activity